MHVMMTAWTLKARYFCQHRTGCILVFSDIIVIDDNVHFVLCGTPACILHKPVPELPGIQHLIYHAAAQVSGLVTHHSAITTLR